MCEVLLERPGEGQGVSGEDRAERGREDGRDGQDEGDEVPLPYRPVERVVGVVGRLGNEDDGDGPGVVALQVGRVGFRLILRSLGVVEVPRCACGRTVEKEVSFYSCALPKASRHCLATADYSLPGTCSMAWSCRIPSPMLTFFMGAEAQTV